jgi:hypothetical protein
VLTVKPELVDRGDGMQEPGEVAATIRLRRLPSSVGYADRDRLVPYLRSNAIEVLYQRAYALTVAQWRCVIVLIRSGSSIRNRHAFAHAATIAS